MNSVITRNPYTMMWCRMLYSRAYPAVNAFGCLTLH